MNANTRTALTVSASLGAAIALAACQLAVPHDVMGNFEVTYADNVRVYINDELVAEVTPGEKASIEYNGTTFDVSAVCGDDGTDCPSETYSHLVAVDQPWGPDYNLLNFVNLDTEGGVLGQRMGGTLADDSTFSMLSGLAVGGNDLCAAVGVGTVTGSFSADDQAVENGVITFGWAGGCDVGDGVGVSLRLETDYTATRVGDFDISSVTADDPIDEQGDPVDPQQPDDSHQVTGFDPGY
ncbi:MAG: hypothetical protein GXP62_19960 [Oligoflexia bacterium]|nr:hypothetical protein [Oligoflexia bacterium]